MASPKHTTLALACAVLVAFACTGQAGAATLMVNGDTPAARFQEWSDQALMPTYQGVVDVFVRPCPYMSGILLNSCSGGSPDRPTIYIGSKRNVRFLLLREQGHILRRAFVTAADAREFVALWGRWSAVDFAESYAICSMFARIDRHTVWTAMKLVHTPGIWQYDDLPRPTCKLVAKVAGRAAVGSPTP